MSRTVLHPLFQVDADALTETLQADGIPVSVRVDGPGVVLWPALTLTTPQQVHAMKVVVDATDAPVRWAGVM